jgi:hypothetical protein
MNKYLYAFRFQYPLVWINPDKHEVFEFVFIKTDSQEQALKWGNCIAEKFIEELLKKNAVRVKINYAAWIDSYSENELSAKEQLELESFPLVSYGEYPSWNFENY